MKDLLKAPANNRKNKNPKKLAIQGLFLVLCILLIFIFVAKRLLIAAFYLAKLIVFYGHWILNRIIGSGLNLSLKIGFLYSSLNKQKRIIFSNLWAKSERIRTVLTEISSTYHTSHFGKYEGELLYRNNDKKASRPMPLFTTQYAFVNINQGTSEKFGDSPPFISRMMLWCECLELPNFLQYFLILGVFFLSLVVVHRYVITHLIRNTNTQVVLTPSVENIITQPLVPPPVLAANNNTQTAPKAAILNDGMQYVAASIHRSIYLSGKKAGLSAKTIKHFIDILSSEINFSKEVHDGDKFALLIKKQPLTSAKTIRSDEIVAAELISKHKTFRVIRFTDASGKTNYYNPDGTSIQSSFSRSPVPGARITSPFSLHRYHPVLHVYRAHLGVDFGGSIGTPVRTTGDGHIAYMGWKNGYGRAVLVQHDSKISTLYAHLAGFPKKLGIGSTVHQGQPIGFLGCSGICTGPHVHYEFRVYGVQHNPMTVQLPHLAISNRNDRIKFLSLAKRLTAMLNANYPKFAAQDTNDKAKAA